MAHYAFIDENNIVVDVIRGIEETELIEGKTPEVWYGEFKGMKCLRTSINGNIRKNYAGIGYTYDEQRDAFIPFKPYPSWTLDEETCGWVPPKPEPQGAPHYWDEAAQEWIPRPIDPNEGTN